MRKRAKILIILVFLFSLMPSVSFFISELNNLKNNYEDDVSSYISRFSPVKNYLSSTSIVGYITDNYQNPFDNNGDLMRYILTQYALAPIILEPTPDRHYVIGNFHNGFDVSVLKQKGLVTVADLDNGILLLRNVKK